jgi:hypothetical protein
MVAQESEMLAAAVPSPAVSRASSSTAPSGLTLELIALHEMVVAAIAFPD